MFIASFTSIRFRRPRWATRRWRHLRRSSRPCPLRCWWVASTLSSYSTLSVLTDLWPAWVHSAPTQLSPYSSISGLREYTQLLLNSLRTHRSLACVSTLSSYSTLSVLIDLSPAWVAHLCDRLWCIIINIHYVVSASLIFLLWTNCIHHVQHTVRNKRVFLLLLLLLCCTAINNAVFRQTTIYSILICKNVVCLN